jgi:monoamine oxidase
MARTPLFDALRRALLRADALRRGAAAPTAGAAGARVGPTRRQFLGTTAGALALPLLPSCSGDAGGDDGDVITVAVIGGGIAGLHCAVRLAEAGVDVQVYEASGRTGGRLFTGRDLFPDGQICELGGELVDSGHTTIQGLCAELGLALDDLTPPPLEFVDVFFLETRATPILAAELVAPFMPLAERMAATVMAAEADDAEFARIDAMSIPQWLETEAGLPADDLLRQCIEIAYVGEYGLEVDQQSIFNLLYLIDYTDPDPFRVYGDSDERYHIHAGSQAVTDGLAARLAGGIQLGHVLTAVALEGGGDGVVEAPIHRLTFESAGATVEVRARHVVLATPFTALRQVDLTAAELPAEKLQVIAELGYGTNSKLMLGFANRFWETLSSNGGLFSDIGDIQATWDSSRGQAGTTGILTNFVGGERGLAMGEGTAEERAAEVVPNLNLVFSGITKHYVDGSAVRQHWPSAPFHLGSYACYRPGQWAFYGTEGERAGNVHFCGEHTSLDFQGYMEGGAETGALVALEILTDLGLPPPAQLARLLEPKLRLPQAAYRGEGKRLRRGQRRALGAR